MNRDNATEEKKHVTHSCLYFLHTESRRYEAVASDWVKQDSSLNSTQTN